MRVMELSLLRSVRRLSLRRSNSRYGRGARLEPADSTESSSRFSALTNAFRDASGDYGGPKDETALVDWLKTKGAWRWIP